MNDMLSLEREVGLMSKPMSKLAVCASPMARKVSRPPQQLPLLRQRQRPQQRQCCQRPLCHHHFATVVGLHGKEVLYGARNNLRLQQC